MKLTIEALHSESSGNNVRTLMSKEDWDLLRSDCYRQAGYTCEICGGKGKEWPVECHEVWKYDLKNKKQILVKLQALCTLCHQCKHIGRTTKIGKLEETLKHFRQVNRVRPVTQNRHIQQMWNAYWLREDYNFTIDITYAEERLKELRSNLDDLLMHIGS